ncbi:hypothetical protein KC614_00705 [candidate division WWE3 bacterium]|uniref:SD-repeat containing protein B domain-containing protein n=1 Tax=candidate division WWE3 bacterium TaxID=2053526 RepID=A0A955LK72_UNCKA|nr:hypothetical protein [candidate division WWE3 bacterium]
MNKTRITLIATTFAFLFAFYSGIAHAEDNCPDGNILGGYYRRNAKPNNSAITLTGGGVVGSTLTATLNMTSGSTGSTIATYADLYIYKVSPLTLVASSTVIPVGSNGGIATLNYTTVPGDEGDFMGVYVLRYPQLLYRFCAVYATGTYMSKCEFPEDDPEPVGVWPPTSDPSICGICGGGIVSPCYGSLWDRSISSESNTETISAPTPTPTATNTPTPTPTPTLTPTPSPTPFTCPLSTSPFTGGGLSRGTCYSDHIKFEWSDIFNNETSWDVCAGSNCSGGAIATFPGTASTGTFNMSYDYYPAGFTCGATNWQMTIQPQYTNGVNSCYRSSTIGKSCPCPTPTPTPVIYNLSGHIWQDDGNGIEDEVTIADMSGYTVEVRDIATNSVQADTLTSFSGMYSFTSLSLSLTPDEVYVHFVPRAGDTFTLKDQGGDDCLDSDVNASGSTSALNTVTSLNCINAGVLEPPTPTPTPPSCLLDGTSCVVLNSVTPTTNSLTIDWGVSGCSGPIWSTVDEIYVIVSSNYACAHDANPYATDLGLHSDCNGITFSTMYPASSGTHVQSGLSNNTTYYYKIMYIDTDI